MAVKPLFGRGKQPAIDFAAELSRRPSRPVRRQQRRRQQRIAQHDPAVIMDQQNPRGEGVGVRQPLAPADPAAQRLEGFHEFQIGVGGAIERPALAQQPPCRCRPRRKLPAGSRLRLLPGSGRLTARPTRPAADCRNPHSSAPRARRRDPRRCRSTAVRSVRSNRMAADRRCARSRYRRSAAPSSPDGKNCCGRPCCARASRRQRAATSPCAPRRCRCRAP